MDLSSIALIVGIIGGIIGIILNLQKLFPPPSVPQSQLVKLSFAIGIVVFLYGGVVFASAASKIDSNRQSCLSGRDSNSYQVNKTCNTYANSRFVDDVQQAWLYVGASFVIIAFAFFLQNFASASIAGYVLQLILLLLGIWLIKSSF